MTSAEPFTFGIALVSRQSAGDWDRVQELLDLTLASLQSQTEQDYKVVIAGHERPRLPKDPRISFLAADWPAEAPDARNADSGRKHHAISEHVLHSGGGLLMFVDADDWVDVCTVEVARRMIPRNCAGGLVEQGLVVDLASLQCAAVPHPRIFPGDYHRICGSGGTIRLDAGARDDVRRNPYLTLRPHNCWVEHADAAGLGLAKLPTLGSYVINHAENHSEIHGPHAQWRAEMTQAVNHEGGMLCEGLAARFGLTLERIRTVSSGAARTHKRHDAAPQGAVV
ncbi:MAG: glycosyltransferase family A protein [Hyphomicrobiales bacterium]